MILSHHEVHVATSPVLQRRENTLAAPAASLEALKARLARMQQRQAPA